MRSLHERPGHAHGEYRAQIVAETDPAELDRMHATEARLATKMTEAIDKELDSNEAEEKRGSRNA
jgi:hypothetical protein